MNYVIATLVPKEISDKAKRLLLAEIKAQKLTTPEQVELRFSQENTVCRVIDTASFETIARLNLIQDANKTTEDTTDQQTGGGS